MALTAPLPFSAALFCGRLAARVQRTGLLHAAATGALIRALAVFAVYVGALLLVGTCSSRVRFDRREGPAGVGGTARVRSGFRWAKYYYYTIAAALAASLLLLVVVQAVTDIDKCYADPSKFYGSPLDINQRNFCITLSRLAVGIACVEALFLRRMGSFRQQQQRQHLPDGISTTIGTRTLAKTAAAAAVNAAASMSAAATRSGKRRLC